MRIALITETYNPEGGGAERSAVQTATELATRGHAVTMIAGYQPVRDPLPGTGIEVVGMTPFRLRFASRVWRFWHWARQQTDAGGFDVSLSVTMAAPAVVVQPRGGTVRETHARNVAMRPTALKRAVKRLALALTPKQWALLTLERKTLAQPRLRKLVAVSRYVADQLERHYRIDPAMIELIPNAASLPPADDAQRAAWRQRVRRGFNIPDDALVFLFAAYNPKLKGAATLLRAADRLAKRGLDFVIVMAGEVQYAQQHLAAQLGVRDRVRMVGPTHQMAQLYAAADVTVLPTWYDPASKVVIESLMMGVPAISTRFNGASDLIVGPNGNGALSAAGTSGGGARGRVIADPGDADALAQAMAELADPAERDRCRTASAGLADQLDMARHVDRLEQVLVEVAAAL
jgi:UDP-glucose:(heptosyl)LPS alpha-1,3-glucosyltransferase